jgi:hypothetical protein
MDPSKIIQHCARRIQTTIGMPSSEGQCNRGRKPRSGCKIADWVQLEEGCQCGGSCAAARETMQLDGALPLVSFQQHSAPSAVYDGWIKWAERRLQEQGPTWCEGRMQVVLTEFREAMAAHEARVARMKVSLCMC